MDLLTETVAMLPPDAWLEVSARLGAAGRGMGKTHRTAQAWLIYHSICMERYKHGPLPEHWPEPSAVLMTMACDRMPRMAPPADEGGRSTTLFAGPPSPGRDFGRCDQARMSVGIKTAAGLRF